MTRKYELLERQQAGRAATRVWRLQRAELWAGMTRVFTAAPALIYEPEGTRPDYWRMARPFTRWAFGAAS